MAIPTLQLQSMLKVEQKVQTPHDKVLYIGRFWTSKRKVFAQRPYLGGGWTNIWNIFLVKSIVVSIPKMYWWHVINGCNTVSTNHYQLSAPRPSQQQLTQPCYLADVVVVVVLLLLLLVFSTFFSINHATCGEHRASPPRQAPPWIRNSTGRWTAPTPTRAAPSRRYQTSTGTLRPQIFAQQNSHVTMALDMGLQDGAP